MKDLEKRLVESYYYAMLEARDYIIEQKPEYLIIPMRGAYPFMKAVYLLASLDKLGKYMPKPLSLPIGTTRKLEKDHSIAYSGITKPEKIEIIKAKMGAVMDNIPYWGSVLMLDEVINGGTIYSVYRMLNKYIKDNRPDIQLKALGIEQAGPKSRRYRGLSRKPFFRRITTPHLLVTDNQKYLPVINGESKRYMLKPDFALGELLAMIENIHFEKSQLKHG